MKRFSDVLKTGAGFEKARFELHIKYGLSEPLC